MSKKKAIKERNRPTVEQPRTQAVSGPSVSSASFASLPISTVQYSIALFVIVALAFGVAINNNFLSWDDNLYVTENNLIKKPTWEGLLKLLRSEVAVNFHPITMFSLWLTSFLFGASKATPFIVGNIIIHAFNTFLAFKISLKLTKENALISFLIALFWAIHPMHIESVVWVAERKDVLYTLFFFLAILEYIRFVENAQKKHFYIAILYFVLSCLSKGMAVVFPLVVLLIDFWYGNPNPFSIKNVRPKALLFVISLLFGLLAIHVQAGGLLGGLLNKTSGAAALSNERAYFERISLGFYSFLVYLIKFFIPVNLRNFYTYPGANEVNNFQYIISPFISAAVLAYAYITRQKRKEFFFGIGFFFFTIVTVLQFISVGGALLAERYSYIPYFGLSLMTFVWLNKKISNPKTLLGIAGFVALIFGFQTFQYAKTYKDTGTLFENAYKYEPFSRAVNASLAIHYDRLGYPNDVAGLANAERVIKHGELAIKKDIKSQLTELAVGNAWFVKKDSKKALEHYQKAIELAKNDKWSAKVHYKVGLIHYSQNQYPTAAQDFSNALTLSKDTARYLPHRAYSLLLSNEFKKAFDDYSILINKNMDLDTCYNHRAVSRFNLGDKSGAILDLKESVRNNPRYEEAINNLKALGAQ